MSDIHRYFIINPVSGNIKGLQVWNDVHKKLKVEKINFSFGISECHKHGIQLVLNKHKEDLRHFICIGNDGTLNEKVNGIRDS